MTLSADLAAQALSLCDQLCRETEVPGEITRTFLSPPTRALHAFFSDWAARLGMETRTDAVGNLIARLPGTDPGAGTFLIGSHLDTVPNGGRYDGLLGVVMGYLLAEGLAGERLPYTLEIAAFSEEEGVRFGVPFIGSSALVGEVGPMLDLRDAAGVSVREVVRAFGLDPEAYPQAELAGDSLGYLEFHIEQGPVLEAAGVGVGIVSAIAGQHRLVLTVGGRAGHAGTTPMEHRRDALAGAAELILDAERTARAVPGLVATAGRLEVRPGAVNVIPGAVTFTLDLRHADDTLRRRVLGELLERWRGLAGARGLALTLADDPLSEFPAVPMDATLRAHLARAAAAVGLTPPELVSGAGHDAMILARKMPAAMVFLRSPGGLSHHPDEAVREEDVREALALGLAFLRGLGSPAQLPHHTR